MRENTGMSSPAETFKHQAGPDLMLYATGAYTAHDAEHIDHLIKKVGRWRLAAGLTIPEVLIALRYSCERPDDWEAACARAEHSILTHRAFYAAQEIEGQPVSKLDGIAQGFGYKTYRDSPERDQAVIRNIAGNLK